MNNELIFRMINNFSAYLVGNSMKRKGADVLYFVPGIQAELRYQMGGKLGILYCHDRVVMKEWQKLNCTVGRHVLVKDNDQVVFAGTVIDVDEEGAIIVRNEQGIVQSFNFGEISIR